MRKSLTAVARVKHELDATAWPGQPSAILAEPAELSAGASGGTEAFAPGGIKCRVVMATKKTNPPGLIDDARQRARTAKLRY